VNLSPLRLIVQDIVSYLPVHRSFIDQSHIGHNILERCDKIDLSSHIREVVHYVHILVLGCPVLRQGDLHLLEIEAVLPMYLVLVSGNYRDGPGVGRVGLGSKR
jgi:hypothetical protein